MGSNVVYEGFGINQTSMASPKIGEIGTRYIRARGREAMYTQVGRQVGTYTMN